MAKNLTNSLSQYLDDLGRRWIDRRAKEMEVDWNRNFAMIKGEDAFAEKLKKGEAGTEPGHEWRSKHNINIVRVKVFSLYAMLLEILMPNDDIPFSMDPAPIPGMSPPSGVQPDDDKAPRRMQEEIRHQLKLRRADRQMQKKLLSLLYYGITWSKYNMDSVTFEGFRPESGLPDNMGPMAPQEQQELQRWVPFKMSKQIPGHEWRSTWNLYWDLEADPDALEKGQGVFEREAITLFDLRQKIGKKGYIKEAIEKVILDWEKEKLPDKAHLAPGLREIAHARKVVDNREYWVRVPKEIVERFERDELKDIKKGDEPGTDIVLYEDETGHEAHILAETANGEIIRYKRRKDNFLPYHMGWWEENLDEPDNPATAMPHNMAHVQHLFTGLVRAFIDNKMLSGNVITASKKRFFADPSQREGGLYPGLDIDVTDDCQDARQAIQPIMIPDVGEGLLSALGLAERWKDVVSMVPEILQGAVLQKQKPDTAYEMSQLMENAGKYVGQGIRNIDELLIEPEINDIYRFNMMDPDFPMEAKGNYKVVPGGFVSYKTRVLTVTKLQQLLGMALMNEVLAQEVKIRPHLEEIYHNLGFVPDKFLKSEEEKMAEAQQREQIQQKARMTAIEDFAIQKRIETQGKLAEIEAKKEGESEKSEEDFQRDIVKGALEEGRAQGGAEK